ncbi:hypothetical protein [Sphingobacterium bambusae]|uniref:Uncharacterized protein n=1 Tax=Sphingobacterium bambusae TaxID=662858 RepID=A0ABW6BA56_9SPHI|nr:hypothetical protein [Sphingobacterium bambusae]WPL48592.1 hypothetical protein SCB77_21830 [Sphingobacterium bambusae]
MAKKLFVTSFLLWALFGLSFAQGRLDYKSSKNESLYFATAKNVKNWFSLAINSSKAGGYYTLNGSQMDKPLFLPIKEAYELDNGYYAIRLTINDSPFYFLFSRTLSRALLVSFNDNSIPLKIEMRNALAADTGDSAVKIEDMLALLHLLL